MIGSEGGVDAYRSRSESSPGWRQINRGASCAARDGAPFPLRAVPRQHICTSPRDRNTYTSAVMEYKTWWWVITGIVLLIVTTSYAEGEIWEEGDHEILIRNERGAKNRETCRYIRGSWSECDAKTNIRSRTLTLKKGDPASCERSKTIQKKCKKACRYDKSSWSECSVNGEMSRTDMLKANSDPTCDQSRRITKKCNKNKQAKSAKDKGRRNRQ